MCWSHAIFFSFDAPYHLYGPTPFARHLITDMMEDHCSHISACWWKYFDFLAPMVICARPAHHPYGSIKANVRIGFERVGLTYLTIRSLCLLQLKWQVTFTNTILDLAALAEGFVCLVTQWPLHRCNHFDYL